MQKNTCKILLSISLITLLPLTIYFVIEHSKSGELLTNSKQPAYEMEQYSIAYLNVLFDKLDAAVKKGEGYSRYLNTDGFPTGALLAWSESYLLQAYVNMYRAVGKKKYLDKLSSHINSVISNRDDKTGQKDYQGNLIPAWGTNKYTKNKEWTHYAVHTGMIAYPILDFVQLVKDTNASKYKNDADTFLEEIEKSVDYHNKYWVSNHYVYPEGLNKKDHALAVNQQAAMGRCLILLYKITGKQDYLEKATLLAEFIKDKSVRPADSGGYVVTDIFRPGENVTTDKIADISHAVITIHFAYLAYKNDIVFDKTDMLKFAKNIADSITDLLFKKLRIDLTARYMQEDWWGQLMLGLSRLTLYQASSAKRERPESEKAKQLCHSGEKICFNPFCLS